VCDGISEVDNVVAPTVVTALHVLNARDPPELAVPVTNLRIESLIAAVVSLVHPVGAAVCWKPIRVPEANSGVGAVEAQVVPLEVSTLPVVLGATASNALVPLPINTLFKVREDDPVPPSATAKSVMPVIVPPVIVAATVAIEVKVAVPAEIETAFEF
jgi:hypothetical protein